MLYFVYILIIIINTLIYWYWYLFWFKSTLHFLVMVTGCLFYFTNQSDQSNVGHCFSWWSTETEMNKKICTDLDLLTLSGNSLSISTVMSVSWKTITSENKIWMQQVWLGLEAQMESICLPRNADLQHPKQELKKSGLLSANV